MKLRILCQILTALLLLKSTSIYAQVPNYVPTNGLVGWYPFNGNANDESGNGNNGSPGIGVALTTDRFFTTNAAYAFNGSGNISLASLPTSGSQDFTISGWVKTNNTSVRKGIACWGQDTPWNSTYFFINNNGYLEFDFAYNGGPQSPIFIADNNWHSVSITCTNGLVQLYLDGLATGSALSMSPNISGSNKALGANIDNSGSNNFVGNLDDFGIWNRALTPAEITGIYNTTPIGPTLSIAASPSTPACAGSPVTLTASTTSGSTPCQASSLPSNLQTGLVGYWPFCGNANDMSGNGNNGTTMNGVTLTMDRFGNANSAYSFDGIDDYIVCNNNNIPYSGDFSISFWNYTPNYVNWSDWEIICLGSSSSTSWGVLATNNGSARLNRGRGCSGTGPNFLSGVFLLNSWDHYTFNSISGITSIYKNGVQIGQTTNGPFSNCSISQLFFGNDIFSNPEFYIGKLDDIAIYNRSLTATEVQQLYSLNTIVPTYSWSPGGATTQSITVSPTVNTTYSCTVTANSASTTSTYTVNVLPAPTITATNASICSGQSTTLTAAPGTQSTPCSNLTGTLATGLVGYWPFCGNANDVSGNGNNGTVNGATLTTDRFGNVNSAYSFDGVNDLIRIPHQQSLNLNGNYSISLWIKGNYQGIFNNNWTLISKRDDNGTCCSQNVPYGLFVPFNNTNNAIVGMAYASNGNYYFATPPNSSPISLSAWQNIIVTNYLDNLNFYLNGTLIYTTFMSSTLRASNLADLLIGSVNREQNAEWMNGKLDDIGIWNRALTSAEIQQLYTQGQTTYSWTPGGATTPSITVSPTSTTTYSCAVTNANGTCSSDFVLTVNPLPSAAVTINGSTSFCPGSSVQLCAPTGTGNTYLWSGNLATTSCITVSSSQTTSVTVTSPAGCSATSSPQQVVVFGNPVANAGPDMTITCAQNASGAQIGAAPNAAYTYSWSPSTGLSATNIANPIANPTVTTTYTLTVVNADGCTGSDQVVVTVNKTPPTANAGLDFTKTCATNPTGASIGMTAVSGNTYAWTPSTGLSSAIISNPLANPSTTTNYTLTATNTANGCIATDQVLVTVNTQIPTVAPISGSNSVCEGATLNLSNTTSGGTWSSSNTNVATVNSSGVVSGVLAGAVNITYSYTDVNGCSNSALKNITVNPTPNATITVTGSLNICPGQTVTLCAPSGIGYTYLWCNGTTTACTTTSFAGTYCLIVTNSFGCSSSNNQINVNVLPTPTSNAGPDVTKNCIQNFTGAVIGTTAVSGNTYSWSPATGLSSSTIAQPTANPLVTTTYTLTTTNSAGCTATDQVIVTVNTFQPTANAGLDFTKTCLSNVNGATAGTTSVTGNTYAWTPTTGLISATISNPTANPTTTTTYTVTTTNTASGCTATDQVVVTVNNQGPTVNAGLDLSKTCVSNINGANIGMTAISGNTYSWTPAIGLSSTTISNPFANPTVTTTYTLSSTDPITGCTASDQIVVTVNNIPPSANAGLDATVSCNSNVGGAQLGTPTVPGNTYAWTPTTGLNSSSLSQPTANPTANTTYNLTVTNTASGCTSTDQVLVTVNTTPASANAGPDGSINCTNSSTGLSLGTSPVAGMTYAWTPSTGLSSASIANPVASPTAATVYTLTVTNAASGCTATDQVTVFINTQVPSVDAGLNQIICAGTPVTLIGNGSTGATFQWDNGVQNGVAFVPTTTTTYTLTATAANGCTATDQVIVAVNPLPSVSAGPDINACDGSAVTLVGTGALTYTWQPAIQNGQPFIPVNSSAFIVTGTDANNCQQSDTVQVNVVQSTSSTLNESACDSYTLNGQTYTQSGMYTQVIPNGSGCDSTITLNLNMAFSPITPVITLTNGVTLSTAAQANLNFQWINCSDLTPIAGATGTTFTASMNGVYAVVASNGCGSDTSECSTINTVGINDLFGSEFAVYPNPTNGVLNIQVSASVLGKSWKIYDIHGRLVADGNIEAEFMTLSIEHLSRGSYWLHLGSHQPVQVVKD